MSDEEQIHRVLALYARCQENHDAEAYVALFAEDGRVVSSTGEHVGRAAIKKFIDHYYASQPPFKQRKHLGGNSIIDVHGDEAEAMTDANIVYERSGDSPWQIVMLNRYVDRFVRRDNAWLFVERRVERQ